MGTLYGIGVGPGDPKMMTVLAVETIQNCQVLAIPADGKEKAVSYKIASKMVPDIEKKECIDIKTPMTKDEKQLKEAYLQAAIKITEALSQGKDVAYLTLGDPTIYSTYIYIHRQVAQMGYPTKIINGIPSFCAASGLVNDSLVDRSQQLHVIPGSYDISQALALPGTKVLMKAGSKMPFVKEEIRKQKLDVTMIENCGMETETIYRSVEEIPDDAGYYSLIIVRDMQ